MNKFKFDAMVEEFPFLSQVLKHDRGNNQQRDHLDCDGISIKRTTRELMEHTPSYQGATGSLVGINDGERFDFVLDDGIIRNAVHDSGYVTHNEAHQDDEQWNGETVLEAIVKHGVADKLAYIVRLDYGYNVQDHYSQRNYQVVIFKPAKDFTWQELVDEAKAKALAEVQAEANF